MTDTLWQSFANANAAAREVEALHAAIEQAVAEGELGGIRASEDDWTYESWSDEDDWIASYAIQSIKIRDAGARGAARGTLSIAISLYRSEGRAGEGWPGGQRAKIYVGVALTAKAWDEDSLLLDGSGRAEVAEPRSRYRWFRTDNAQAWFFCVALEAIDSRDTLINEVIRPVAILLAGTEEETAFAASKAIFETGVPL